MLRKWSLSKRLKYGIVVLSFGFLLIVLDVILIILNILLPDFIDDFFDIFFRWPVFFVTLFGIGMISDGVWIIIRAFRRKVLERRLEHVRDEVSSMYEGGVSKSEIVQFCEKKGISRRMAKQIIKEFEEGR